MISVDNKIVLITGASSGIGEACARAFAAAGARLILCARRIERLEALSKELTQNFGKQHYIFPLDVRLRDEVETKLSALPKEWKDIEVLINNAGLALETLPLQAGVIDHWETMIDTNIKGLLYVSKQVLPGMIERDRGHVINLGSMAGHSYYPNGNVYSATKHAVKAISKSMRLDMLGSKIRVTEIAPGAVETEFSEVRWNDKQRAKEFYQGFEPLIAEDIADAALYCATRPLRMDIEEMVIMPTAQASSTHLHRTTKS